MDDLRPCAEADVLPPSRRSGRRALWLLLLVALPIVGGVASFAQQREQNERIAALAVEQGDRARALLRVSEAAREAARRARNDASTADQVAAGAAALTEATSSPLCGETVRSVAAAVVTAVLDSGKYAGDETSRRTAAASIDSALERLGAALTAEMVPPTDGSGADIVAESRGARDRAGTNLAAFTLLGLLAGALAVRSFSRVSMPVATPRTREEAPSDDGRQAYEDGAPSPETRNGADTSESPDSDSEPPLEEMGVAFSRMVENLAHSESLVRDKEARLRMILETAADGIVTIDRFGSIESFNAKAKDIFGYREVEVLGKSVSLLVSEAWAIENRRHVEEYLASGKSGVLGHVRQVSGLRKDGTTMPLEVVISEARVGKRVTFTSIVRDITERKAAEEKRSRLIRELESKNAEMERFTYTVSHDLKSPLITIRGFLGLLEKDLMAGHADRVRADLTHIHTAVANMQTLLSELLELSRIGRIVNSAEQVRVRDLVEEALDRVMGLVAERGMTVDVADSELTVLGDQPRLVEVFQNLVENAAKFCGADNPAPHVRIDFRAEGADVVCVVEDNGVGIDPQYHEKVFVLFERLDPACEGTGIGLALVKRIVELHGGSVWVESAGERMGARFCVRLPRKGGDHDVRPF